MSIVLSKLKLSLNISFKPVFDLLKKDWKATIFVFAIVTGLAISYSVLYLFHIFLIYLIAKLCCNFFLRKRLNIEFRQPTHLHLFFIFFLFWFGISILWSADFILSIKYLFYIFCGTSIAYYYIFYSKDLDRLKLLFLLTSLFIIVEIIISILEVTTDFRLPVSKLSYLLPYFNRDIFLTPEILAKNDNSYLFSMPTGFQWNPNSLSALLCIAFPFFLGYSKKIVSVLGSLVVVFLVVSAGARASFFTLIVVYIVYFILYANKKAIRNYIIPFCFLFILTDGFYVFPTNSKKIYELSIVSNSKYKFEVAKVGRSESARKELFFKGIKMFSESPIVGHGGNGDQARLLKDNDIEFYNLHFFWLELLVNGGIIFALMFGIWYLKLLLNNYNISRKSKHKELQYFAQSSFLALLGFVITAIGPGSCIYFFPMYILLGFSIATINNYQSLISPK